MSVSSMIDTSLGTSLKIDLGFLGLITLNKIQSAKAGLECSDFIDWKKVCNDIEKKIYIAKNREKCLWQNVKIVQIHKDEPFTIHYKTNYRETEYSNSISVRGTRHRNSKNRNTE